MGIGTLYNIHREISFEKYIYKSSNLTLASSCGHVCGYKNIKLTARIEHVNLREISTLFLLANFISNFL